MRWLTAERRAVQWRGLQWRAAASALVLAGMLTGCGDDGSDEVFDDTGEVAAEEGSGSGSDGDGPTQLSPEEENEVILAYQEFLAVSDDARFDDEAAVARLPELAAPEVVAQIDAWKAENAELEDEELNIIDWVSYPNVSAIGASGDGVVIDDCVEAAKEPVVDISGNGIHHFIDQQVTMSQVDGQWLVAALDVRNDGSWRALPEEYSCVPRYHQERIGASLQGLIDEADALLADPAAATEEQLDALLAEPLRTGLGEEGLPFLVESNWSMVGQEEVVGYQFLGSRIQDWKLLTLQVCLELPEGRRVVDAATGEPVTDAAAPDPLEPGTRILREVSIRFDDSGDGIVDRIASDDVVDDDADCGEDS